jgi:hypothetical protein
VDSIFVVRIYPVNDNKVWNLDSHQKEIFLDELANAKPAEPLNFIKYISYKIDIKLISGKRIKMDGLDGAVVSPIDTSAYFFRKGFSLKELLK